MTCKVNWPRLYKRQRLMKQQLAERCNCTACKKVIKTMKETDKVMKINEDNRTPREERKVLK